MKMTQDSSNGLNPSTTNVPSEVEIDFSQVDTDDLGLPKLRTVNHYGTQEALQNALMAATRVYRQNSVGSISTMGDDMDCTLPEVLMDVPNHEAGDTVEPSVAPLPEPSSSSDVLGDNIHQDWILPSTDRRTTEAQSMKEEIWRLQVLKSYQILDSEPEETFDTVTAIAARVFDVPIALVSLVDLGR
jgi:hypothetical protein